MGLPSSRPWIGEGGFVYQLTQRVLLQWSPADERTRLANLYELLERHGFDDELLARQVPRPEADGSTSLAEATQIRLGWLTDSGIAAAFAQNPIDPGNVAASLELHGLPMSRPERIGPFVVQRFQRTALQRWVEAVDGGQSVGSVVLVNGGDYFKDFLFADSLVAAPHTPDDARLADVRASPSELVALDLATATDRAYNVIDDAVAEALRLLEGVAINDSGLGLAADLDVAFRARRYPREILAVFTSPDAINLNHRLAAEDARVLAAVMAHELAHLEDFHSGLLDGSRASCLLGEQRAIAREAQTWGALVGPDGKQAPLTDIERVENARLRTFQEGGGALERLVGRIYADTC